MPSSPTPPSFSYLRLSTFTGTLKNVCMIFEKGRSTKKASARST
jgi:hypothetical protein